MGDSLGGRGGASSRAPRRSGTPDPRAGQVGAPRPGHSGPGRSTSPGRSHSQSSDPPVPPLKCLLTQSLDIAFQAHLQRLFLIRGRELWLLLSLCKPLRALQSNPTPAPHNFSSSPPPPPPLQDTPPVISCVNHTGCLKTWNRNSPTVVSSFVICVPTWKCCPVHSCNKHPLKI